MRALWSGISGTSQPHWLDGRSPETEIPGAAPAWRDSGVRVWPVSWVNLPETGEDLPAPVVPPQKVPLEPLSRFRGAAHRAQDWGDGTSNI